MLLEPGMAIYGKGGIYGGLTRHVIDRVTEKQAIVKINDRCEDRFNREVGDGHYFRARGSADYDRTSYSIETPELRAKYLRQKALATYTAIIPGKLTDDQLSRILAIASEPSA